MTRILITSQVYYPSHDAVSQLLDDLSQGLIKSGIEVNVLTSAVSYMTGKDLPRHEMHNGVRIWRVPNLKFNKGKFFQRAMSYGAFLVLSGPTMALIPKPDVVMYLSTPPLLGWSASFAKRFGDARTVFVAQDVYPEILKESRHLKNPIALSTLSRIDKKNLQAMDRIIVLGEKMKDVMESKGVASSKISIIENWSIAPGIGTVTRKNNSLLTRLGLNEKFVVQYSGNMGVVHDMEPIIDAARRMRGDGTTAFLIIGDGKRKTEISKCAEKDKLQNIHLLPYQPIEELPTSLAAANVALISLRPEMEGLVVPSKLYGIMASGKPIINIGHEDGEVARVVSRAKCGFTVKNGEELSSAIVRLRDNGKERQAMGVRAKQYFDEHFGKERSIKKYQELIQELVD